MNSANSAFKKHKTYGLLLILAVSFLAGERALTREARAEGIPVLIESSSTPPGSSSTISAASSTPPAISDEEIDHFLFHIPQNLQGEVKKLDASSVRHLRIPILFGVAVDDLQDTWGERRRGGRVHRGTDIIVARGSFIVSPTDAVVTNIGYDKSGGNFVLTANPGGEQFYYAHLESAALGLTPGSVLAQGDLIGYVGDTGNARRTTPHLHLGIYYEKIAVNPYPRLTQEFSLNERVAALEKIVDGSQFPISMALTVIDEYPNFLKEARLQGLTLPKTIAWVLENNDVLEKARMLSADMKPKAQGGGVRLLQKLLINAGAGPAARALARAGVSGYFGARTENALREYQKSAGISPAQGRFGPATRAHVLNLLSQTQNSTSSKIALEMPEKAQTASTTASFDRDLSIGSTGNPVKLLQQFLIETNVGLAARTLANAGVTGYFGPLTRKVLAEYQLISGITPANGYFGWATRALVLASLSIKSAQAQEPAPASQESAIVSISSTATSSVKVLQ